MLTDKSMRYYMRNFTLTAVSILAILFRCPALQANTAISISITGSGYGYDGFSAVGPYGATLNGVPNLPVFCLDENISTATNTTFYGYYTHPLDQYSQFSPTVYEY